MLPIRSGQFLDHILLAGEVTETDRAPSGARELEVGRFPSHLNPSAHAREGEYKREGYQKSHRV